MTNPHLLTPIYKKQMDPHFAGNKYYLAAFRGAQFFLTRRKFRRASEAETYASRIHARWIRLYDAAIVAMSVPEPTA